MRTGDIARQRLRNQRISKTTFRQPGDIVHWLGAVQAQDYHGAKWALAQRGLGLTDAALDKAFDDGAILRTHALRPTWHFVAPGDIRWILQLTAPRVHAANAFQYRKLGLDSATFGRAHAILTRALQGGQQRTRLQLMKVFQQSGIAADGLRGGYLMMQAELDGLVCSGARQGKQFTYALLEERVPPARELDRDEALAELSKRYFMSRGPATLKDFVGWSGLTVVEAKAGLDSVRSEFQEETIAGQTYWFPRPGRKSSTRLPRAHLLATYDEYWMGYQDRSAAIDEVHARRILNRETYLSVILLDGRGVGSWRRTIERGKVVVVTRMFIRLSRSENDAVDRAVQRYGEFHGLPALRR